jgi:hypothetical protein
MLIISNFCIRKVGVKLIGWCVNQTGLINKFRQYLSSQSRPDEISDIISIILRFSHKNTWYITYFSKGFASFGNIIMTNISHISEDVIYVTAYKLHCEDIHPSLIFHRFVWAYPKLLSALEGVECLHRAAGSVSAIFTARNSLQAGLHGSKRVFTPLYVAVRSVWLSESSLG